MENQIYLLFNRLANRYVTVLSYETDELCKARLSDPKVQFNHDELEVCKVGSYNIANGHLTCLEAPERIEIPRSVPSVDTSAVEVK